MLPGSLCRRVWVCLPGWAGLASRLHVLCARTGQRPMCSPMLCCHRREKDPAFSACTGSGRQWSWPASSVSLTRTSGPKSTCCHLVQVGSTKCALKAVFQPPLNTARDHPSRLFSVQAGSCAPNPQPAPLAGILSEQSRQIFLEIWPTSYLIPTSDPLLPTPFLVLPPPHAPAGWQAESAKEGHRLSPLDPCHSPGGSP